MRASGTLNKKSHHGSDADGVGFADCDGVDRVWVRDRGTRKGKGQTMCYAVLRCRS